MGLDVVGETMKCFVDLADLIGLYLVMNSIAGKGQLKFLIAGMGWATSELVMTRFIPLWVGARGIEFDWKYIQMSFDSNVSLIQHISTALLVWLWSRHDLHRSIFPVVVILLTLSCYRPLIVEILVHVVGIGSWTLLLAKAAFSMSIGFLSLQIYQGLTQDMNSYY